MCTYGRTTIFVQSLNLKRRLYMTAMVYSVHVIIDDVSTTRFVRMSKVPYEMDCFFFLAGNGLALYRNDGILLIQSIQHTTCCCCSSFIDRSRVRSVSAQYTRRPRVHIPSFIQPRSRSGNPCRSACRDDGPPVYVFFRTLRYVRRGRNITRNGHDNVTA